MSSGSEIYEKILQTQGKIMELLTSLDSKAKMSVVLQLCRDNDRDVKTLKELNNMISQQSTVTNDLIKKEIDTYIEEARRIDEKLNNRLMKIYEVAIELNKRIYKIKGFHKTDDLGESLGLMKLINYMKEAIDFLKITYKKNSEKIVNTYNEIVNSIEEIKEKNKHAHNVISEFSIERQLREPIVLAIPVARIIVDGEGDYVFLDNKFEEYKEDIMRLAKEHKFGVNRYLVDKALSYIKGRKGPLYRLFLKLVVKIGKPI